MIKAITFDLWWTILNYSQAIVERRLALLSLRLRNRGFEADVEEVRDAHTYVQNLFGDSWERAKRSFSPRERVEALLNRIDISLPEEDLRDLTRELEEVALEEPPDLVQGVEEAIRSLSKSYSLGIISDTGMTPGRVLRPLLAKAGLLRFFSSSLFSDEIGYYKPHPTIFTVALRDLAVLPEEAVHIGDNPKTDVQGAKGVGMKAILFNRSGSAETEIGQADAVIEDYHGLREVVEGL